jgi:hypothetical protein
MLNIKRGTEKLVISIPFTKYVLKLYKTKGEQWYNEKTLYRVLKELNIVPKTLFFHNFAIQEKCTILEISEMDVISNNCDNILEYLCKHSKYFVDMDAFLKSFSFIYKDEILYSMDNIGILNNKVVIIDFGM